jgi:iron complex outermembrane recepter protein
MKKIFFCLLGICTYYANMAQNKLTIKVVSNALEPIDFALVKIPEINQSEFTSTNGLIRFNDVPKSEMTIEVIAFGYQTKQEKINLSENTSSTNFITIKLEVKYNLIQEVQIAATRAKEKSGIAFQNMHAKTIKDNNIGTDIPMLLNNQTSVVSTTDNGTGVGYSSMRIRGTDAQRTNVTINGIPFNDPESQGVYFVNMPDLLSSVGSIQIQRGVGSATSGSGAFGASINMQTEGLSEKAYAEVGLSGGSYGFNKQTLKFGTGLINEKIAADIRLSHIGSKGYVNNSTTELSSYFATLGYYGKLANLKFITFSGNEKTGLSYNGIPEALLNRDKTKLNEFYNANAFYYPTTGDSLNLFNGNRQYNSILYNNEDDNYKQTHYQLHYAYQKDRLNLNVSGHYTKGFGYYEQYKFDQKFKKYGLPNVMNQIDSSVIKNSDVIRQKYLDNDFAGLITSIAYKVRESLNFTFGASYNEYNGLHFGKVLWTKTPTSISTFPFEYYRNNSKKTEAASYLKLNYQPIEKLNIGGELQVRKVNYTMNGLADEKAVADTIINASFDAFINPRISVSYDVLSNLNAYVFYGSSKKEPNRDDYKASPFKNQPKVEALTDFESGIRYQSEIISANLNYFNMQYNNQLVLTGLLNDVGDQYRTNVAKSYRQGIEIELNTKLNKQFALSANTTFSENKILNYTDVVPDYFTNESISTFYQKTNISYSPNFIANINVTYKPIKNFSIYFNVKHVGKQYLDNTTNNAKTIAAYTVGDLRLDYVYSSKWLKQGRVYVQINNAFNTQYVSNGYTVNYYLGTDKKYMDNYYLVQAPLNFIVGTNFTF